MDERLMADPQGRLELPFESLTTTALSPRWWVLFLRGLLAIAFGILAFALPRASLDALVLLFGAYALVDGALGMSLAAERGRAGARLGWHVFEGVVGIIAGLLTFAWPGITALILTLFIGGWAILTGVAEIVLAVELRRLIEHEWSLGLAGALSVVFGVLLFVFPALGALALLGIIGAFALVFGALLVTLGLRLRHGVRATHTPRFA